MCLGEGELFANLRDAPSTSTPSDSRTLVPSQDNSIARTFETTARAYLAAGKTTVTFDPSPNTSAAI